VLLTQTNFWGSAGSKSISGLFQDSSTGFRFYPTSDPTSPSRVLTVTITTNYQTRSCDFDGWATLAYTAASNAGVRYQDYTFR
jgi:hypothetical protein